MPTHRGQVTRTAPLVGHLVALAHAQSEGRIVVKEERGDMVVVDHKQHIRLAIGNPLLHRFEGLEDRGPHRVVLLVAVKGKADGGGVRGGDGADDLCHGVLSENGPGAARPPGALMHSATIHAPKYSPRPDPGFLYWAPRRIDRHQP